jgi:ribose transport system permease protein
MEFNLSRFRAGSGRGQPQSIGKGALDLLEKGGLPILLVIMFMVFALDSSIGSIFTNSANIKNILGNQAVTALVAVAMVIPLVAGYFDLSVSGTTGVANVALAAAIGQHSWSIGLGLLLVLAIGALIGFVNGFLIAKLQLSAFVVTLGMFTLLGGLAKLYTGGRVLTEGIPGSFTQWGSESWFGVPRPFILLLVIALGAWYLLSNTPFGRYLEGIGSNEQAARLVGINTTRTIWISFILSGMLAAVAGALQTSRAGNGSAETGATFLLPAFTAVFLGATTIRPGRYNVWGTLVGVYFIAVSVNGLSLLGAEIWVQPVFNGAALIVAVALTTFIARARERRVEAVIPVANDADPGDSPKARDVTRSPAPEGGNTS